MNKATASDNSLLGRTKTMFQNHVLKKNNATKTDLNGNTVSSQRTAETAEMNNSVDHNGEMDGDPLFLQLRREAAEVAKREPILTMLLSRVGLLDPTQTNISFNTNHGLSSCETTPAKSFNELISRITSHRLSSCSGGSAMVCPNYLQTVFLEGFASKDLEMGHTMSHAVREDALCVWRRDPACETLLEVVLFMKGFLSLVVHRAARRAWKPSDDDDNDDETQKMSQQSTDHSEYRSEVKGTRFVALLLQSQASSAFGVDIHPAASIGAGVMIDHATGVVIGETATVGDGTTILHGVTLGGTGKESGDRHPKIGKDVLIGAGTKILGNIIVGDRAKIGAGSVVLRAIPSGATAVGSPARIIGFTPKGERPGSTVDISLMVVEPLMVPASTTSEEKNNKTKLTSPKSKASSSTSSIMSSDVISKPIRESISEGGDTEDLTASAGDEESEEAEAQPGLNIEDETENEDNVTSGSEDDDEVTDFGTPAKLHYVETTHDEATCPFRNSFPQTASSTSKDLISHKKLRSLLIQEGCSDGETVEVFFELLHLVPKDSKARQCGCIPLDIFAKYFPEIGVEKTHLDRDTCVALAKGDLRNLGMSKKASRKFKGMFQRLDKIPSSTSLTQLARPRRSSSNNDADGEEQNDERHYSLLDTSQFAAEIAI